MDKLWIEMLIDSVKSHPCLYDKEQATRFNIDQKNQIWIEIANKLDKPVEKCKHKWRNLRDSYLKAIRSKHDLGCIGQLSMHRSYKYEDSMSFLEASSLQKRRSSTDGRSRFVRPVTSCDLINESISRRKRCKKESEYEYEEQAFTTTDAEYLIENDRQTLDDEENSIDLTTQDEEEVVALEAEKEPDAKMDSEHLYETPGKHELTIGLPYQEVYSSEPVISQANLELDLWMAGIKATLMVNAWYIIF